ncbi:class I SAM-dependent methyltransferase [Methylotenera sp. G11]|uniref:class I SAM-dependent methyltransferase n=1 Tax=Methylotenera sp. G11 TaxID=1506585 RepID=UPI000647755D|nr:class I SAM-dependent methyltransferase [Methylotenera sp. G11]
MNPEVYLQMESVEREHWWFQGRRAIISHVIGKMDLPQNPAILEAGCGTGGNLAILSQLGATCAFEMNDAALDIALKNACGAEIHRGQLPDAVPFQGRQFDLICMFDVLEHIADDVLAVEALSHRLAPDGYLFVTVPALPMLWSEHDVKLHHHRRYARGQLMRVMEQAGLAVSWVSYFNFSLLPVAVASRLYAKIRGIRPTGDELPPAFVNRVFAGMLSMERHMLFPGRLPIGLSLAAVVRHRR